MTDKRMVEEGWEKEQSDDLLEWELRLQKKYWPIYCEKVKELCELRLEKLMDKFNLSEEDRETAREHLAAMEIVGLDRGYAEKQFAAGGYEPWNNRFHLTKWRGSGLKSFLQRYENDKDSMDAEEALEHRLYIHGTTHELGHFLREALHKLKGKRSFEHEFDSHEFIAKLSELLIDEPGKQTLMETYEEKMKRLREQPIKDKETLEKIDAIERKIKKGERLGRREKLFLRKKAYRKEKINWKDPEKVEELIYRARSMSKSYFGPFDLERMEKATHGKKSHEEHRTGYNLAFKIHNTGLKEEFIRTYPNLLKMEHEEILKAARTFLRRKRPKMAFRYVISRLPKKKKGKKAAKKENEEE